jgi:hypothetical protein
MADFDKQKFADYLDTHLSTKQFGEGACAKHVRLALAAGGLKPVTWPVPAREWGGTLLALGFSPLPPTGYSPQLGDIAVIQPVEAGGDGHIEGYNGKNWVSDFVQVDFWPSRLYVREKPAAVVYRRDH